jgi:hypothetical protein
MLSPLPRRSDRASSLLIHPVVSAFPDRVVGSACASTFSRLARRSLALRPAHSRCHQFVTRITEGFSHFVTSMTAPVASGWSDCRVGLAPTGKRHLFTAHTPTSHSRTPRAAVHEREELQPSENLGKLAAPPRQYLGGSCMKALRESMLKKSINTVSQENHDQHELRPAPFFHNRT